MLEQHIYASQESFKQPVVMVETFRRSVILVTFTGEKTCLCVPDTASIELVMEMQHRCYAAYFLLYFLGSFQMSSSLFIPAGCVKYWTK